MFSIMAADGAKPGTRSRFSSTIIRVVKDGFSASNKVVGLIKATLGPKRNITTSFAIFF